MLENLSKQLAIALFLGASVSIAIDVKAESIHTNDPIGEITKVESLRDIQDSDWTYKALQNLSDRYGCQVERINLDRGLTRYEFALVLNECLEQIKKLDNQDLLSEDIQTIQKLTESFATELSRIKGRVDRLSDRIKSLEETRFSPNTKLSGTLYIQLADTFGDRARFPGNLEPKDTTKTLLGYAFYPTLDTSFTGKDLLKIGLRAIAGSNFDSEELNNTRMTRPGIATSTTDGLELSGFYYRFPILNDRGQVTIAENVTFSTVGEKINPVSGVLSRFGNRNPLILRDGGNGAALRLGIDRAKTVELIISYLAEDSEQVLAGNGLFNGSFATLSQLFIKPTDNFKITLDYVYKYQTGASVDMHRSTGSPFARRPFEENATKSDNLGFAWEWELSENFQWGGWFGIAFPYQLAGGNNNATLINWATALSFPDLFAEGNSGGIIIGMPPKVVYNSISNRQDPNTSFHFEVLYNYKITEFLTITPGFFVATSPNHDDRNSPIWVTLIRTKFSF